MGIPTVRDLKQDKKDNLRTIKKQRKLKVDFRKDYSALPARFKNIKFYTKVVKTYDELISLLHKWDENIGAVIKRLNGDNTIEGVFGSNEGEILCSYKWNKIVCDDKKNNLESKIQRSKVLFNERKQNVPAILKEDEFLLDKLSSMYLSQGFYELVHECYNTSIIRTESLINTEVCALQNQKKYYEANSVLHEHGRILSLPYVQGKKYEIFKATRGLKSQEKINLVLKKELEVKRLFATGWNNVLLEKYYSLANSAFDKQQYAKAFTFYTDMWHLDKENPVVANNLGVIYCKLNKKHLAKGAFMYAYNLVKPSFRKRRIYLNLINSSFD